MKIAIPLYGERIAPLFEVAEAFLLFEPQAAEAAERRIVIAGAGIREKCRELAEHGVDVLICGALSRRWDERLRTSGIEVHAFIAANAHTALQSFLEAGATGLERYAMPGRRRGQGKVHGNRRHLHRHGCYAMCDFDQLFKE